MSYQASTVLYQDWSLPPSVSDLPSRWALEYMAAMGTETRSSTLDAKHRVCICKNEDRTARILPTRLELRMESVQKWCGSAECQADRNRNCFDSNLISLHVGTGCNRQSQIVRCARPFPLVVQQADSANLQHTMYFTSPNYFFIYAGYLSYTACLQTGHEPWSTSHLSTQGWWKVWEQLGNLLAVSPATMSCKMKDAIRSLLMRRKNGQLHIALSSKQILVWNR